MEILRNKLQSLYSSMEVQILPDADEDAIEKVHTSSCLSMQDLLENSLSLEMCCGHI